MFTTFAPLPYHALTLEVTKADFRQFEHGVLPDLTMLRGTCKDANIVDRLVYVDDDGNRTYLKDRYPPEHMLATTRIVEHVVHRPRNVSLSQFDNWCADLIEKRMRLRLFGTVT